MNKIILTGRLTKDVEIRTTGEKENCTGNIAVSRSYKNKNGEYETDFFEFTMWNPNDYIKKNLKKGSKILIEGQMHRNSYNDKNGEKKVSYQIAVQNIEVMESKKEGYDSMHTKTNYQDTVKLTDKEIDEMFETPF